jgi:uncharacterized damage-inducible protein DinB
MDRSGHLRLMARYNTWMNDRLLDVAARVPAEALAAERGAFFGSILGTLNHLIVTDTIWLQRFATHPANYPVLQTVRDLPRPQALDERPFDSLPALAVRRELLDRTIESWVETLTDADLDSVLRYPNSRGEPQAREMYPLLIHFFNHQTHHRGQTTTLLSQAGVDIGVTDVLSLVPQR